MDSLSAAHILLFIIADEDTVINCQAIKTELATLPDLRKRTILISMQNCSVCPPALNVTPIDFTESNAFERTTSSLIDSLRTRLLVDTLWIVAGRQKAVILNDQLLPWTTEASPSFDFLWPSLIVEPHVIPHKHPTRPVALLQWLESYCWSGNIGVVGPAGIGKSTALRFLFLRICDSTDSPVVPLLPHAADISELAGAGDASLLHYVTTRHGISIPGHFTRSPSGYRLAVFVDGIDEIHEKRLPFVIETLGELSHRHVIWVGCRKDFFSRHIAVRPQWNRLFYETLEVQEWDEGRDALPFVKSFGEHAGHTELYNVALSLRERCPEVATFLKNPFELTLLIHLLLDHKGLVAQHLADSYSLYSAWYENWLGREVHRGTAVLLSMQVATLHQELALLMYRRGPTTLADFAAESGVTIPVSDIVRDSSFMGVLRYRLQSSSGDIIVDGFKHETLAEFLGATGLLAAFKKGGDSLRRLLEHVYKYEMNRFVRAGFGSLPSRMREQVYGHCEELYFELFHEDMHRVSMGGSGESVSSPREAVSGITADPNAVVREQLLYYVGRLPLSSFPQILEHAHKHERYSLLRRTAALGAVLHGNEGIERAYLDSLIQGSPQDIENRSVQVVYFGDVEGEFNEFQDNGGCDWTRTRAAIYERLRLTSQRELRLRWWDLRTLCLFYQSRDWRDTATDEELRVLSCCETNCKEYSTDKALLVRVELDRLLDGLRTHIAERPSDV
jgi:hypothetical protein